MVAVDGAVQRQGCVAFAPRVADACLPVDHERVDVEGTQPRRESQTVVACAEHEDGGVAVLERRLVAPIVGPARAARDDAVDLAFGATVTSPLGEGFERLDLGLQRVRDEARPVADESRESAIDPVVGREVEEPHDVVAGDEGLLHGAHGEAGRAPFLCELDQPPGRLLAADGMVEVPREGHEVAPRGVAVQACPQLDLRALLERGREFCEPGREDLCRIRSVYLRG